VSKLELFVPSKAASHRQKKVSEEIRHHLADALIRGDMPPVRNPKNNEFISFITPITITKVETSADLKHTSVSIIPLGGTEKEKALTFVRLNSWYFRKIISAKMRLRHAPMLHFSLDESFDESERMFKLIADAVSSDDHKSEEIISTEEE
jgi:ribosome-binding factor A